jgi:phenylalanyl-tRNA synthetase alpha chain
MTDIAQLEQELTASIAAAADEAALEAVRIATLGKSGSVTALLKTLGGLTPDERRTQAPRSTG